MITRLINTGLASAYAPARRRLLGVRDLRDVQTGLLTGMLRANADAEFGRAHDFASLRTVADFQAAVPLSRWDDYQSAADRIADGERGVLTTEPVRLLEPSSGSTAATKLIPYTRSLAAQFQAGLKPWLADLYLSRPQLRRGRSYWSVTPAATHPQRSTAIPIGFEDDAAYLGPLAARLLTKVFAVPQDVARAPSMDEFRLQTSRALLGASDLALVSVWNPSFLTLLLDWMQANATEVLTYLPARRRVVCDGALQAGDWAVIWPHLGLLSCWADVQAARPAAELAARFPDVELQPKGLLATEAIVSIPVTAAGGAVLAAHSHFYEFLDSAGQPHLADELEPAQRYEVVVTTGGGLYRYRMGDLVEVTGHHGALPILRFAGRADKVSDLVGEKLNEAFVASCLDGLGAEGFAMLAPRLEPAPHYVIYTDRDHPALAAGLDAALRASFHYDYARRLGQLGPVRQVVVGQDAADRYLATCVARGQRLGDIKPTALAPVNWPWTDVQFRAVTVDNR